MLRVWWNWLRESGWKWQAIILATFIASVTGWLRGTIDVICVIGYLRQPKSHALGESGSLTTALFASPSQRRRCFAYSLLPLITTMLNGH
jgi:hypothetical protein